MPNAKLYITNNQIIHTHRILFTNQQYIYYTCRQVNLHIVSVAAEDYTGLFFFFQITFQRSIFDIFDVQLVVWHSR